MDCNSYSYAPYMLDKEHERIAYYENDDMYMELERVEHTFCVSAYSYDGSLDVAEEYRTFEQAAKLYRFCAAYRSGPPGDELQEFINSLRSANIPKARLSESWITFGMDGRETSYQRGYGWTVEKAWKDYCRSARIHKER